MLFRMLDPLMKYEEEDGEVSTKRCRVRGTLFSDGVFEVVWSASRLPLDLLMRQYT